jgi:hypothetical protein
MLSLLFRLVEQALEDGLFYLTTPLVSNNRVVEQVFLFNNLPKRKIVIFKNR